MGFTARPTQAINHAIVALPNKQSTCWDRNIFRHYGESTVLTYKAIKPNSIGVITRNASDYEK